MDKKVNLINGTEFIKNAPFGELFLNVLAEIIGDSPYKYLDSIMADHYARELYAGRITLTLQAGYHKLAVTAVFDPEDLLNRERVIAKEKAAILHYEI